VSCHVDLPSDKSTRNLSLPVTISVSDEVRAVGIAPCDYSRIEASTSSPVSLDPSVHGQPPWSWAYSALWNVRLSVTIAVIDDVCARLGVDRLDATSIPGSSVLVIREDVGTSLVGERSRVAGRRCRTRAEAASWNHGLSIAICVHEGERPSSTGHNPCCIVSAISVPVGLGCVSCQASSSLRVSASASWHTSH